MRVLSLQLKNIGPFKEANLQFFGDEADIAGGSVTLITGENGTGKSIILDAIRGAFGEKYCKLERNIARVGEEPQLVLDVTDVDLRHIARVGKEPHLRMKLDDGEARFDITIVDILANNQLVYTFDDRYSLIPADRVVKGIPNWVVDFWQSTLATDTFNIHNLVVPSHEKFLDNALQGQHKNVDVTQLICYFDYLRDSRDPSEKRAGDILYEVLEQIVHHCLLEGGYLSHVARSTLDPIIVQNGQQLKLANLSSGNLYLIQRMVGLLGKMYAVHVLHQTPPETLCQTPGLLLIDEAEAHLHPKWQKMFIPNILDIFPNLQIIAATHSPFIVSSVPEARLFVCQSRGNFCVVTDETSEYSSRPVDDILLSPLFDETQPFNEEISKLMAERKKAVEANDKAKRSEIEAKLTALNPEYFSYLNIDRLLQAISNRE